MIIQSLLEISCHGSPLIPAPVAQKASITIPILQGSKHNSGKVRNFPKVVVGRSSRDECHSQTSLIPAWSSPHSAPSSLPWD